MWRPQHAPRVIHDRCRWVFGVGEPRDSKIGVGGNVTTLAGTAGIPGSGDATSASVQFGGSPFSLATDGSGNVHIAERNNQTVHKINSAGAGHKERRYRMSSSVGGVAVGIAAGYKVQYH
jgi:hypothetical protein